MDDIQPKRAEILVPILMFLTKLMPFPCFYLELPGRFHRSVL
jgi:hypothetical protein